MPAVFRTGVGAVNQGAGNGAYCFGAEGKEENHLSAIQSAATRSVEVIAGLGAAALATDAARHAGTAFAKANPNDAFVKAVKKMPFVASVLRKDPQAEKELVMSMSHSVTSAAAKVSTLAKNVGDFAKPYLFFEPGPSVCESTDGQIGPSAYPCHGPSADQPTLLQSTVTKAQEAISNFAKMFKKAKANGSTPNPKPTVESVFGYVPKPKPGVTPTPTKLETIIEGVKDYSARAMSGISESVSSAVTAEASVENAKTLIIAAVAIGAIAAGARYIRNKMSEQYENEALRQEVAELQDDVAELEDQNAIEAKKVRILANRLMQIQGA